MDNVILLVVVGAAGWFAPVFLAGWFARHWLRKDGDKVIFVGLFLGLLGSAVAALALPRLSDDEWEAKGQKPERAPRGEMDIAIMALVGACVVSGGLLAVALILL
jgi:uncharacterized membrane protein YeaQ/YmgE (transglycosylase-associated protein family)